MIVVNKNAALLVSWHVNYSAFDQLEQTSSASSGPEVQFIFQF